MYIRKIFPPPPHTHTTHLSHRPQWDRCGGYIDGGAERWSELAQGRSSDQLVDVLLAQIAGVDVSQITEGDAFQGQVRMWVWVWMCVCVAMVELYRVK